MEKLVEREITGKLGALKMAIRTRIAAEGIGWVLAAAVAIVFITLGMDWLLRLEKAQRMLVMLAWLCGLAYICLKRLISPMFVPMNRTDLALLVENRFAQLGDRLISAIQFESLAAGVGGMSRAMILKVAHEANSMAGALNFGSVIRSAGAKRSGMIALGAIVLLAGLGLWKPHILGLWFDRNILFNDTPWPQDTYLVVQNGPDFSVVRGDDLKVGITVTDDTLVVPPYIAMHTRSASYTDWIEERLEPVEPGGRFFVKVFQNVAEEFQFYVTGGDDTNDRKRPHNVGIIEPPTLIELEFPSVVYPGYMHKAEGTLAGGTSVQKLPVGCRVSVKATCNKPLKQAKLVVTTENIQAQHAIVQLLREARSELSDIAGRTSQFAAADAAVLLSTADKLKVMQKTLDELSAKQQETGKLASDNYVGRMDDMVALTQDGKNLARPVGRAQIARDCQAFAAMIKGCSDQVARAAALLGSSDKNKMAAEAPGQIKQLSDKLSDLAEIASAIHSQMSVVPLRIRGVEKENAADQADITLAKYLGGTVAADGLPKAAPADVAAGRLELTGKYCIDGVNRQQVANLKFYLTDDSGYTSRKGQEFQVQVQPDQPPSVQLFRPGLSLFGPIITAEAELPLQVQADDEYGVASIQFMVGAKPADGAARKAKEFRPFYQPLRPSEAEELPKSFRTKYGVDLAKWEEDHKPDKQMQLELKPGDTVEIRADAMDNMPQEFHGPNVASSQVMAFQVIARAEFIRLLIAKQKEAQKEFNQIVDMQASAYGKVDDAIKLLEGAKAVDPEVQQKLDESGGLQQTIASQLIKSAGTFRAILDEMVINRVGEQTELQAMADITRSLTLLVSPPEGSDKDALGPCQKVNRDLAACKDIFKQTDDGAVGKLSEASRSVVMQQKTIHAEMIRIMQMMKQVDNLMEVIRELDDFIHNLKLRQQEIELLKKYYSGDILEEATSRPATAPASAPVEPPPPPETPE